MAYLQLLLALFFSFRMNECYNLETSRPIVYEVPEDGEENGYFGMSVAIRPRAATLNDTWTIQIGAPRGHGTGAVYRCHTFGPCRLFEMDEGLSPVGGQGAHQFTEKKGEAWVGVAMDIKPFGFHERSVVCGHRWMNQNLKNPENIDVTYLVTGVCYLQNLFGGSFDSPVQRLLPLVDRDKIYTPKPYVVDLSTYHWGLGQGGISVKLSEDTPDLILIGAPGVTHWIGSVIRYEETFDFAVGNFARTEIAKKNRYTYLGYSVTFGRFYKDREIWYAAGAPRSANYHGEVFTFQYKAFSDDVRLQSSFSGATFGEYFGSSLSAADLNSDGYDDLIVGAPLFSSRDSDEGRIYVYLGTERGNFLIPAQVINGRIGESRFGSCVTSVGDLDQDGHADVVVGAPYEDNQKGAVYVFRGFAKGLETEYSQRILAEDIHPHLRGFGVSVTPGVDVDGNRYLDIAVGSYLSGHVVLLRSRPVISLHPRIKTENASLIDRKLSHFNVTVCTRFAGSNAPDYVDIIRMAEVDPVYGRGKFDAKSSSPQKVIRLRRNQIICEILSIMLNVSSNFSPLQLTVKNEINPCATGIGSSLLIKGEKAKETAEFPKSCPIGNKAETTKEFPFAGICGADLICRSELELSCVVPEFRSGSYTLGSTELIQLSLNVKNHGEPAHDSRIKIWSNLKLRRGDVETTRKTFWLDVEGLLTENYQTNFTFKIDFDGIPTTETHLNLMVEIFTSSLESNLNNNNCKFLVELQSDADLSFYGSSSVDSAYITKAVLEGQTLNVTHYYEVQKSGVTPVKDAELMIYIPVYYKKDFLTFETETAEWMHISRQEEEKASPMLAGTGVASSEENCPPTNRTLFLNCSTADNDCRVLKIFFTEGIPTGFASYAKIIIALNITAIDSVKADKDIGHVSTAAVLRFSKFLDKEPKELRKTASISLYNEDKEKRVETHVVALSILAGGFFLFLIVTGLVKSNFFRRVKKEELKALKDAEESFVYFETKGKS